MIDFEKYFISSAFPNISENQCDDNKMVDIACKVKEAIQPILAGLNIDEVERVLDLTKIGIRKNLRIPEEKG